MTLQKWNERHVLITWDNHFKWWYRCGSGVIVQTLVIKTITPSCLGVTWSLELPPGYYWKMASNSQVQINQNLGQCQEHSIWHQWVMMRLMFMHVYISSRHPPFSLPCNKKHLIKLVYPANIYFLRSKIITKVTSALFLGMLELIDYGMDFFGRSWCNVGVKSFPKSSYKLLKGRKHQELIFRFYRNSYSLFAAHRIDTLLCPIRRSREFKRCFDKGTIT